ncbi:MAG: PQQ-binding-like beta-propeller repeat protein [Candidatus Bathyarchaeia archaeon]
MQNSQKVVVSLLCALIILLIITALTPIVKGQNNNDQWSLFGHDSSGARYSTSTAPKTNQLLWQTRLGSQVRPAVSIYGSMAYTGSFDSKVYALDASTGRSVWNYTTGGYIWSTPAVVNGIVYVGSNDFNVYALNAETGSFIWKFSTGQAVWSSPAVVNGVVYIGSCDDSMYALDANSGSQLWKYTTDGDIRSSPAVVDGVVYFGSQDGNFYALNASDGTKIWSSTTNDGDTYTNSSPAVADGVVYIGSTDHNLYAFRASDGAKLWTFNTPDKVSSSPAVHNELVYVGSESGDFYAISAASGEQAWNYSTGGRVYSSAAVADGAVYVASYTDQSVYAFDASSGNLLWSYQTGGAVFSAPTISGGVLFVGSYDSYVYAFGTGFTPGSTSTQMPTNNDSDTVWAPAPANGVAASVVTVSAITVTSILAAALSNVPAATTASSFFSKIVEQLADKLRNILPVTVKDWFESLVLTKHRMDIDDKHGSIYRPTKGELVVYIASTVVLTFSFAYVQVNSVPEFLLVLPTFIATSLVVGLVRTYLLTVYARRQGVWTEYKLWYLGIALFIVSTLAFRAPFSSPTRRVSTSNRPDNFIGVVMSVSILLNLVFAGIFFALILAGYTLIGGAGLAMCLVAAFIDTIPVKPMFGADVFQYNKKVWATLFIISLSLYVIWLSHAI